MAALSKLREWRASHGLTLEELSDLTGLSVPMLSRAERGERQLSPLRRVEVARILGVRVRDIFPVPSAPEAERELAEAR
jgi:transcriptional regulator with XRE-family HTH domain